MGEGVGDADGVGDAEAVGDTGGDDTGGSTTVGVLEGVGVATGVVVGAFGGSSGASVGACVAHELSSSATATAAIELTPRMIGSFHRWPPSCLDYARYANPPCAATDHHHRVVPACTEPIP